MNAKNLDEINDMLQNTEFSTYHKDIPNLKKKERNKITHLKPKKKKRR